MIMSTGDLKRVHFAPPLICVHHKRLAAPSRAGARIERNERERENGSVRDEDRERGAAPNGERVDAEVARPREHVSEEEERERPRTGSGGEARRPRGAGARGPRLRLRLVLSLRAGVR